MPEIDCPSPDELQALLSGQCNDSSSQLLWEHLAGCPRCDKLLQQLDRADPLIQAIRQATTGSGERQPQARSDESTGMPVSLWRTQAGQPLPRACRSRWPSIPSWKSLGRGGMGVVYKARQARLNRLVALKMILHGNQASAVELVRFRVEAQAVARLQHPNIVQVYEVGEDDGKPFLSLEFCPGGSLAQRLKGTPLPAREAAQLVQTLARAMQAAHDKNVIHRDLKPANVLLAEDGTLKISDFGLARKLDDQGHTGSGAILGTPSYMAPEQAAGKSQQLGPACDVYALGAILYECLTGRPPFQTAAALDTLQQVLNSEPVAPRQLQPKVPRDLETICLKCLRKDAGKRYVRAATLADDLDAFLLGKPIQARPVGLLERAWRSARRNPSAAAAGLLALLVLAGAIAVPIVLAVREAQHSEQLTDALDRAQGKEREAREAERQAVRQASASTLERALQLCEQGDINQGMLWLVRTLELARQGQADDLEQAIRWNLSAWSREVHTLTRMLPHPTEVLALALSTDGRVAATGGKDGVVRFWDLASGKSARAPLQHPAAVTSLAFRPGDGQTLVTGCADGTARLWKGSEDRPAVLFPHQSYVTSVAFRSDGQAVLTGGRDTVAQLWQADSGERIGQPLKHPQSVNAVALSPDGTLAATGCDDQRVRFWRLATGKLTVPPTALWGLVTCVAFNHDGKVVMAGTDDSRAGNLVDVATGQRIYPPCQHRDEVSAVSWSSDGKLFLTAGRDRTARLWQYLGAHSLGSRLQHGGDVTAVAFDPTGQTLVTASKDRNVRLWRVAGRNLKYPLLQGGIRGVAISPDSRTIATAGSGGVFLWKSATGERSEPTIAGPARIQAVAFSQDGKLLLTGANRGQARLWDLATGKPVSPVSKHGGEIWRVALAPDGKTFLTGGLSWRESPPLSRSARLWDSATGQPIGKPLQQDGSVRGLAYHPDGSVILIGSDDGTTRTINPKTGEPVGEVVRHTDEVRALAFSPDGKLLATGGTRSAQLWEGMTWKPIGPAMQQEGAIEALAFSADGRFLLTGGTDAMARLWHLALGKPIGPRLRHDSHVRGVALSPDGRFAVTGGEDGAARIWEMPDELSGAAATLKIWVQVQTGMALDDTGSVRILDAPAWQAGQDRLRDLPAPR